MHAADTVHAVIDILPEPMLLLDGGGQVLQANRAARELLDRNAPDPTGQPLSALLADAPAALQALLRQGLRSPQFSPGRVTARAPQGGGIPLRCEVARVAATADHPVGVLMRLMPSQVAATRFVALNERIEALSREVARRQRAEEALRTQSEWLEAVLRSIGDAVVATDAQGAVVFMNSVAEGLCGVPAALAAGQPVASVFAIVDGATRAAAPCPVARALRERCIVGLDAGTVLLSRDGAEHPIDDTAGPIVDDDGKLLGVVLVFREISLRLQAEQERRRHEQQLRDAQRMHAVGTLAGGIAHDFNNVLGAILGNARLATEDLDPTHPATQKLAQIERAGRRARDLVRQIMAFSRRQPHRLTRQRLRPMVQECVDLLRSTLPSSVQLHWVCVETPLCVNADPTQMAQVIMNLGTNAWHALHGSSGSITISLDVYDGDRPPGLAPGLDQWVPGRYARIGVADDGVGIPPHVLPRVFEPFFTTKAVGEGTGLGLSVVHGIVAEHGGLLAVHSHLQQGTRFDLLLPLLDAGADEEAPAADVAAAVAAAPAATRAARVIYVDDDDLLLLTTAAVLRRAGHRVTTCADGQAALAGVRAAPDAVDVVVTDYNMPGLDGLQLAAELRRLRPGLPLILTSGFFSDAVSGRARALGGVWLLNKEDSFERLPALIEEVLSST
jgi:PAS domain S-box-containing protein